MFFFLSFTFKFVNSSFLSFCDDSSSPRKRSSCVSVSDCCPTSWSFWWSESGLLVKYMWAKWFFLWHVVPNALHSLGLWWEPQRPHGFLLCFCSVGFGGCFLSGGFVFWFRFRPTLIAATSKAELVRVSIWVLLVSAARTVLIATSSVSSVLRSSRSLTLLLSIAQSYNPVFDKTIVKSSKLAGFHFHAKISYESVNCPAILHARKEKIAFICNVLFWWAVCLKLRHKGFYLIRLGISEGESIIYTSRASSPIVCKKTGHCVSSSLESTPLALA